MNDQHFDALTRRFGEMGTASASRRALLRWLGVGSAAAGLSTVAGPGGHDAAGAAPAAQGTESARPPAGPTPEQLAADLQYDPQAIFRFVRDEILYDPYPGALRGARGTLWGLAGNSVDQALLLAALLNEALVPTRFVVGELSEEAAARLLAALSVDEAALRTWADRVFAPAPPAGDAEPIELTPDEESLAQAFPALEQRFRQMIDRQLADGVQTVIEALAGAGITLPEPVVELPDSERRQHVWLQYADGGYWIDLDPSLPDAEPGTVYAHAATTHDRLPEELFHRVSIRLVAEKVAGGVPNQEELLSFEATSGDLVGVPMTLFHPEAEALKAAGAAIQGAIGGYRNFMPSLIVGDQYLNGRPVTFVVGEGALGAFGDDVSIDGETLGEWLEIDVRTPGGDRRIVREIFDRVGFARRGGDPIDPTAIPPVELVVDNNGAPSYLPLSGFWSLAVVTGAVPGSSFDREPANEDTLADLSRLAHTYHYARDVFALDTSRVAGYRAYLDEPNLTAFVLTTTGMSEVGETASTQIDLLHRSVATVAVEGATPSTHPLVALGVLSHAVERAMMGIGAEKPLNLPVRDSASVGQVFEEAARQGIPTVVLQPGRHNASRIAAADAARMRIEAALSEGYLVVTPERAVTLDGVERTGWWLVDPATGSTLDQMDDGRGVSAVEIAKTWLLLPCAVVFIALAYAVWQFAIMTKETLSPDTTTADSAAASAAAAAQSARALGRAAVGGGGAGALAGSGPFFCV
jgi:hypothetical protein